MDSLVKIFRGFIIIESLYQYSLLILRTILESLKVTLLEILLMSLDYRESRRSLGSLNSPNRSLIIRVIYKSL
jgi:hypothetical protein